MDSANSIASLVDEDRAKLEPIVILKEAGTRARRHSVLDDLRAKRDNFIERARRASVVLMDNKENRELQVKEKKKNKDDKRRNSSVFYVSNELPEENNVLPDLDQLKDLKKARRKSWHPMVKPSKTDRKRRKGGAPNSEEGSTEALYANRQKRPSWWNIFVPDLGTRYNEYEKLTRQL